MRHLAFIALLGHLLLASSVINAQSAIPRYILSADIVYTAEYIPTICAETFFMKNDRLRSWHIDAGYQIHYNDEFGFIFNNGDQLTIGVYQGPVAKIGTSYFTKWRNRKWLNYFSPSVGFKYLWYHPLWVNTGQTFLSPGDRLQSEKCIQLVPQIYVGQKRRWGHFCYDYYFGIQLPVKFRDKTIYREEGNNGVVNTHVPYTSYQVFAAPDVMFGIKLGYARTAPSPRVPDQPDTNEDEKDEK